MNTEKKEITFFQFLTYGRLNKLYFMAPIAMIIAGAVMFMMNADMTIATTAVITGVIVETVNVVGSYMSYKKTPNV